MDPNAGRPASVGPLIFVSGWRLVLAGAAFFGFGSAMTGDFSGRWYWPNLYYFSQLGSLLVGLTALGALLSPLWNRGALGNRGALEGRRGFLRGAGTTTVLLIMIVFGTLLDGGYASNGSRFEHLIVPIMAVVDWLFAGRNNARLAAWWPVAWLAIPVAYLPAYLAGSNTFGHPLYPFLDPEAGDFYFWMAAMLAGYLALGYLVWGLGRLAGAVRPAHRHLVDPATGAGSRVTPAADPSRR